MIKRLFSIALICSSVHANADEEIYQNYLKNTYKNHDSFKEKSLEAIECAYQMMEQEEPFLAIENKLAELRNGHEDPSLFFGVLRRTMLLTPGQNYFKMRECLIDVLQLVLGDCNKFYFPDDEQPMTKDGYCVRTYSPMKECFNNIPKELLYQEREDLELSDYQERWSIIKEIEDEISYSMHAINMINANYLNLTKDEFKIGSTSRSARLFDINRSRDYARFVRSAISLSVVKDYHLQDEEVANASVFLPRERQNPGQLIELKRTFRDHDTQRIFVLKDPFATQWKDCAFVIIHTDANDETMHYFDELLSKIYHEIREENDPKNLQPLIYTFEFFMSAQTKYFRGSSAIKEWFVSALYKFKGYRQPERGFCETDQYAQIFNLPDFIETMTIKDGPLVCYKEGL